MVVSGIVGHIVDIFYLSSCFMMLVEGKIDYWIAAHPGHSNCGLSMHGSIQYKSNVKDQTKKNFRLICLLLLLHYPAAVMIKSVSH